MKPADVVNVYKYMRIYLWTALRVEFFETWIYAVRGLDSAILFCNIPFVELQKYISICIYTYGPL